MIFIIRLLLMGIGFVIMMYSCDSSHKLKENFTFLVPSDSLCNIIGIPTVMKLFDEKLFVVDMFNGDSLITVFDIKTKKKLISFGQRGSGPNEFLHINSVDFKRNSDNEIEIFVFDPIQQKYFLYNYNGLLEGDSCQVFNVNIGKSVPNLHELYKIDGGYIATGKMEENKYVLLSDSLEVVKYIGDYRPKPANTISNVLHRQANNGKTELSLDKKMMAEIVFNASALSLYDIESDYIEKKWEFIIKELDYDVVDGVIVNKSLVGYLSASVGNNHVYALYSGKPENMDEIATYGNEVHVFDLDGKLVDRIRFSKDAYLIQVDEKKGKIYSLCHVPETIVLVYDYSL